MKILVTGADSGLGKFLSNHLNAKSFTRKNNIKEITTKETYDYIIHSAFKRSSKLNYFALNNYLEDTIFLTNELSKIPCEKFIYISSIDVYPKGDKEVREDEDFVIDDNIGIYAKTKLLCEEIVKRNCRNYLILRPSAMLGIDSKENSLIKILNNSSSKISVSSQSTFNYILHQDVLDFIQNSLKKDLKGIYNLASSENIKIGTITEKFNIKNIEFGNYLYKTPILNNNKAREISDLFSKSSLDNIKIFKSFF